MEPTRRSFLVGAGAAALLAACGSDGDAGDATDPAGPGDPAGTGEGATTTSDGLDGELPPVEPLALEPVFGAGLAEIGLRLTDRGGLVDTRDGQYVVGVPDGNHLALYAEPIGDYTTEQYVEGILTVTRLTAPETFRRWPALETYDICQEPPSEVDDGQAPAPATQIAMSAEQAAAFDWDSVTLVDLLAAHQDRPSRIETLNVSSVVSRHPVYRSAADAAGQRLESSGG